MLICELLPLKTTKKINSLTYYTSLSISAGDLVEINMNGQVLSALVVTVADIRSSKSEVRAQDYKIKKISKIINKNYVSEEFLYELYNLATLLGTTLNNIFNTLAPVDILNDIDFLKRDMVSHSNTHHIFATTIELRKFKKDNKNISAGMPNFEFLKKVESEKVITKIIIHNESSKHYYSSFKNIDVKKAIIYICNILNIKVEYDFNLNNNLNNLPSLEVYKQEFLDKNIKLEINRNIDRELNNKKSERESYNKEINIIKMSKNIYLDQALENNILKIFKEDQKKIETPLTPLSKREEENIEQNTKNKKILLYTMRKGMYTQSVCSDCSNIIKCKKCDRPYTLISEKKNNEEEYYGTENLEGYAENNNENKSEVNYHVCNTCHDKIRLETLLRCEVCTSWNIKTLGIGTQGIEKYLEELFEKNNLVGDSTKSNKNNKDFEKENLNQSNIFRIDSDNTSTPSKVEKEYKRFLDYYKNINTDKDNINSGNSCILIATELALPILERESFDAIIIVSLDSAFYITDYNTDERIFFTINSLRKSLKKNLNNNFFLQTRMSEKFIENNLKLICGSDVNKFYIKELRSRERNMLPPYYYILTYESDSELNTPTFLQKYKNLKLRVNKKNNFSKTNLTKNKYENYNSNFEKYILLKYVFFIPKEIWENDKELRSLCLENLYNLDLKINSKEVL